MAESSKISLPIGPKHLNARSIEEVDAEMVRGLNTKALSDRGNKAELTAAIAARDPEAKAKAKLAHVQHPQLVDAFTSES